MRRAALFAAVLFLAAPAAAQSPCETIAAGARRIAHDRNLGLSPEHWMRQADILEEMGSPSIARIIRYTVADLFYERPQLTPQEAYWMALGACGWPGAPPFRAGPAGRH